MTEVPYRALPLDLTDVRHLTGPDSTPRPGVPAGETVALQLGGGAVYPTATHRCWIHVPSGYDPDEPASLMVLLDGDLLLDPTGDVRAGVVLDNLVHAGAIPMTIAVLVDPGVRPDSRPEEPRATRQRNVEYDTFDDRFVEFLLGEVVPEVTSRYAVTTDPDRWGIGGFSSGGSAALTAAWHRPDRFRRVLASSASFPQVRGGNPWPTALAAEDARPLRVFLHLAHRDLGWDEPEGNWLVDNLRVAAALVEAGYDTRLVLGDGGHSPDQLGALLPDALRWLSR